MADETNSLDEIPRFTDEEISAALNFMEMAPKSNDVDELKKLMVSKKKRIIQLHQFNEFIFFINSLTCV